MLAPHRPYLEHIIELGKCFKNVCQILFRYRVYLQLLGINYALGNAILEKVPHLEYERDFTDVGAILVDQERLLLVFIIHFNTAFLDHQHASSDRAIGENALLTVKIKHFVLQ